MNTAMSRPAARLPCPPTPDRLNHPPVTGDVPGRWRSTATSPATANPIRITYSTAAIPTWVLAVILIPATAITSMTTETIVAMPMSVHALPELAGEPSTASTDGPITSTPATAPMTYPAIISQPVRKPSDGLIARPTHSNDAPQLAFH